VDKEQKAVLEEKGYVWEINDIRRVHRMTFYKPDGTPLVNLPADPYHMRRYLRRGLLPNLPQKPQAQEEQSGFTCDICGKTCKTQFGLAGHKRKHKKEERG